jgi:rSAM/selenodomain-associated transferase 2
MVVPDAAMTRISVIIPTLDEAARIGGCLEQFQHQPGSWEVIVADGGSVDGTLQVAAGHGAVRTLAAPPGRGPQQNAGAAVATGEVLLFLHADATLPPGAHGLILSCLAEGSVVAGAFRVRHQPGRWTSSWRRAFLRLANLRSRYTARPYGDQGIFVRKADFEAVGGFPPRPLMEDLHLVRRLARRGGIRVVRAAIQVSGRRFEAGPVKAFLCMTCFPLLDRLGIPATLLSRFYGRPR